MSKPSRQEILNELRASFTNAESGWPSNKDVVTKIKRVISGTVTSGENGSFWIGIGSGGADGTLSRWDNKYKDEPGINCMRIVYKTTSDKNRRDLEKLLIDHYDEISDGRKFKNDVGGGGGDTGNQPFTVYLAFTKKTN